MNYWTISYQYWNIVFCDHRKTLDIPQNYRQMDDADIEACFKVLVEGQQNVWVVCRQPLRRVVSYCRQRYMCLKAAGGIVQSHDCKRLLLIYRNQHWDMAKGKVEAGETLRQAAVREVTEETGLAIESMGPLVLKTYHIYDLYGGWHLKQTSWYEMHDSGTQPIVTQQEEGITNGEWTLPGLWYERLSESYSMMALLANHYIQMLRAKYNNQ